MDKLYEKMPNYAPDGALGTEQKGKLATPYFNLTLTNQSNSTFSTGLLSPVGDAVGQVLDKGLKPVGQITGQVGQPTGDAMQNVEKEARKEKKWSDEDDPNKPESEMPGGKRIGGKEATGQNPLGL